MIAPKSPLYSRFVKAVSRFQPSRLLPIVADITARHDPNNELPRDLREHAPWVYSAIARESLAFGLDDGAANPTEKSVERLYDLFTSTFDPTANTGIALMLGPIFYEQFPYQESPYAELARVQALLVDPTDGTDMAWEEEFGVPLGEALTATMILHTWVGKNRGRYDPSILSEPQMGNIFNRVLPRQSFENFVSSVTTSVAEAKSSVAKAPALASKLRRYSYNPLVQTPLVDLGPIGIYAPQTVLVPKVLSIGNLYYRGVHRWGTKFTKTLGDRVETYVGLQLRSLSYGQVLPEIVYGASERKSVDWIWVTPTAVVLVECKSGRMSLEEKAGALDPTVTVDRYLRKARDQIDESARLIELKHDAFRHIPADRRVIGLTVTAEPFYLGNAAIPEYQTAGSTPTYVVSLLQFESLLQHKPKDIVATLLDVTAATGGSPWTLAEAMKTLPRRQQNAVLESAWKRMFEWRSEAGRMGELSNSDNANDDRSLS